MLSYKCPAILENNNATKNVMAQLTHELLIFSEIPHKKNIYIDLNLSVAVHLLQFLQTLTKLQIFHQIKTVRLKNLDSNIYNQVTVTH